MRQSGFTLLELVVTISIIVTLTAIAVPNLIGVTEKAEAKIAVIEINGIRHSLDIYRLLEGSYPTTQEGLQELVGAGYLSKLPSYGYKNKRGVITLTASGD